MDYKHVLQHLLLMLSTKSTWNDLSGVAEIDREWCSCVSSWTQITSESSIPEGRLKMIQAIAGNMTPDRLHGWNSLAAYPSIWGRVKILDMEHLCFKVEANGHEHFASALDIAKLDLKTFPQTISIPLINFVILNTSSITELVQLLEQCVEAKILPHTELNVQKLILQSVSSRVDVQSDRLCRALLSARSAGTLKILCSAINDSKTLMFSLMQLKFNASLSQDIEQAVLEKLILECSSKRDLLTLFTKLFELQLIPNRNQDINSFCIKTVSSHQNIDVANDISEEEIIKLLQLHCSFTAASLMKVIVGPCSQQLEEKFLEIEDLCLSIDCQMVNIDAISAQELMQLCTRISVEEEGIPERYMMLKNALSLKLSKLQSSEPEPTKQIVSWIEGFLYVSVSI